MPGEENWEKAEVVKLPRKGQRVPLRRKEDLGQDKGKEGAGVERCAVVAGLASSFPSCGGDSAARASRLRLRSPRVYAMNSCRLSPLPSLPCCPVLHPNGVSISHLPSAHLCGLTAAVGAHGGSEGPWATGPHSVLMFPVLLSV